LLLLCYLLFFRMVPENRTTSDFVITLSPFCFSLSISARQFISARLLSP